MLVIGGGRADGRAGRGGTADPEEGKDNGFASEEGTEVPSTSWRAKECDRERERERGRERKRESDCRFRPTGW